MAVMRKAGIHFIVLLALFGFMAGSAYAGAILRPAQGATVRGKVQIEISRKSVGSGGYAVVSINDLFRTAVAGSDSKKSIIFIWDTKSPLADGTFSSTYRNPNDGPYRVGVEIHDATGKIVERDQIGIILANKIVPRGSGKLYLKYRYAPDSETWYREKIDAQATQLGYFASQYRAGEVDIASGEAQWRQLVDDVQGNGNMTVRMKVTPESTLPGSQIGFLPAPGGTVYATLSKSGMLYPEKRSQGNALSAYTATIPVVFPTKALGAGDTWTAPFVNRALVKGGNTPAKGVHAGKANHTLVGYEWESGHPCAKIRSIYNDKGSTSSPIGSVKYDTKVEQTGYFAYDTGKMLRTETKTEIRFTADQNTIGALLNTYANLTRTASSGTPGSANPGMAMGLGALGIPMSNEMSALMSPNAPPPYALPGSYPPGYYSNGTDGTSSGSATPTGTPMSIVIEVNTSSELVGK